MDAEVSSEGFYCPVDHLGAKALVLRALAGELSFFVERDAACKGVKQVGRWRRAAPVGRGRAGERSCGAGALSHRSR